MCLPNGLETQNPPQVIDLQRVIFLYYDIHCYYSNKYTNPVKEQIPIVELPTTKLLIPYILLIESYKERYKSRSEDREYSRQQNNDSNDAPKWATAFLSTCFHAAFNDSLSVILSITYAATTKGQSCYHYYHLLDHSLLVLSPLLPLLVPPLERSFQRQFQAFLDS